MNNFEERMQMAKTTFVTRWKTDTRLVISIRDVEKAQSEINVSNPKIYFRPKIEVKQEKEPDETGLEGIRKASKEHPSDSDSEHYEYVVEDIPRETCNFGSTRPLPEEAFLGAKTLSDSE